MHRINSSLQTNQVFALPKKLPLYGCGALNWDIFFEVDDLEEFSFEGFQFFPGEEYVFERKSFLELYENLKREKRFLAEGGGGSSANTIYALAKMGFKCGFIGAVGEDPFGEKILEELKALSVDTSCVIKGGETSLALIFLDKKKDRAIVVSPGTAESYLSYETLKSLLPRSGLIHLSSFASTEGKSFHLALLSAFEGIISLDPGEIYAKEGKDFLSPFLKKAKFLFITEKELKLSCISVEELLEKNLKGLFIKMGSKGALAITRNYCVRGSVYPPERVVDNTGAGDYFNAGVLAGILLGIPLEEALDLGLYSASVSLRDFGRKGVLSYQEFKNFLSRLK